MSVKVEASVLGFPRVGAKRELKRLVEAFWKGGVDESKLIEGAAALRRASWTMQKQLGLNVVPCNDFSLYDQVLDAACLVGAVPPRYNALLPPGADRPINLQTYFAMARGIQSKGNGDFDLPAMEMKKYFDTNYHYLVPELDSDTEFRVASEKPFDEFAETQALAISSRPVLLGPVSFLLLAKPSAAATKGFKTLSLLDRLLPVYGRIVQRLVSQGASDVQFDEPMLCMDPTADATKVELDHAYKTAYAAIKAVAPASTKLLVTTYFQSPHPDLLATLVSLPVHTVHIDVTRSSPGALSSFIEATSAYGAGRGISLGIVDGRNIWKVDADNALATIRAHKDKLKTLDVKLSSSCSLLHSPWSIEGESRLDSDVLDWMAFAKEKVVEIVRIAQLVQAEFNGVAPDADAQHWLDLNRESNRRRRSSIKTHDPTVRARTARITRDQFKRKSPAEVRRVKQQEHLHLPLFPTTTIGSFPQTAAVRKARADFKKGTLSDTEYDRFIAQSTEACVRVQEELELDVLVHGEFERNDMVEFFSEFLTGTLFTANGWVQSYGSRCVKPPVIYGDVSRPQPMTVQMTTLAQSMTRKPVKAMLTGPVTILQWSFVRNDQPRQTTCQQIALAIRDEVDDLQRAEINVIQVDEPAIREGLPMRKSEQAEYLRWSVDCFLLASCVAADHVQLHSHMCYSDFEQIVDGIRRMDADVLSIESSRSDLKLLSTFVASSYPNQLGPGLYDIHSPRVPSVKEMLDRASTILKYLTPTQLWVNPDCGLKTRDWPETTAALANLVQVAKTLRQQYSGSN